MGMTHEHNIEAHEGDGVRCKCGWTGPRSEHDFHWQSSVAREALEEAKARAAHRTEGEDTSGA